MRRSSGTRKPLWFCAMVAILWGVASATAFRLVCFPLSGWPLSRKSVACLLVSLLLIAVAEGLLAGILLVACAGWRQRRRGRWSRAVSALGAAATIALLACWLMATALSWWSHAQGAAFLHASALWSAVEGASTIAPFVSHAQALLFLGAVGGSLAAAAILTALAPAASPRDLRTLGGCFAAMIALLFCSSKFIPARLLGPAVSGRMEAIFKGDLLPSATILWGHVLFPGPAPSAPGQPLLPRRAFPAGSPSGNPSGNPSAGQPNFVVIVVESFRAGEESRLVGGVPVMPNVSRLAREGVQFTSAYAASNESSSSMVAMQTSLHALKHGGRDSYRWKDFPGERFSDALSPAYATGFFSSSDEDWQNMKQVSKSPKLDRFLDAKSVPDQILPGSQPGRLETSNLDDRTPSAGLHQWIEEVNRRTPKKPFLAVISYQSSHYPYQQGLHVPSRYVPCDYSPAELARCAFYSYPREFTGRMKNRYWNSLSFLDTLLGETMDVLARQAVLDRTVLIVTGDHGEMFYENGAVTHSLRLYEGVLHVPLVVWGAGRWRPQVYAEPVSLLDVGPMILMLAGFPPHGGFQGRVPPGLENPAGAPVRPIFSMAQNLVFEDSVLAGPWRLTRQEDGLYQHLYNVAADPFEREDRTADHPEIADCLSATLVRFRRSQLSYYSQPEFFRKYFPPTADLADIAACDAFRAPSFFGKGASY